MSIALFTDIVNLNMMKHPELPDEQKLLLEGRSTPAAHKSLHLAQLHEYLSGIEEEGSFTGCCLRDISIEGKEKPISYRSIIKIH